MSSSGHQQNVPNSASILPYQNGTFNAYAGANVRSGNSATKYGGDSWVTSGKKGSVATANLKNGMFIWRTFINIEIKEGTKQ